MSVLLDEMERLMDTMSDEQKEQFANILKERVQTGSVLEKLKRSMDSKEAARILLLHKKNSSMGQSCYVCGIRELCAYYREDREDREIKDCVSGIARTLDEQFAWGEVFYDALDKYGPEEIDGYLEEIKKRTPHFGGGVEITIELGEHRKQCGGPIQKPIQEAIQEPIQGAIQETIQDTEGKYEQAENEDHAAREGQYKTQYEKQYETQYEDQYKDRAAVAAQDTEGAQAPGGAGAGSSDVNTQETNSNSGASDAVKSSTDFANASTDEASTETAGGDKAKAGEANTESTRTDGAGVSEEEDDPDTDIEKYAAKLGFDLFMPPNGLF